MKVKELLEILSKARPESDVRAYLETSMHDDMGDLHVEVDEDGSVYLQVSEIREDEDEEDLDDEEEEDQD